MKRKFFRRVLRPFEQFFALEASSGIVLALSAAFALLLANGPFAASYMHALHLSFAGLSLQHWINDGLMVVFFFVVGMEIKRELAEGELADRRRAALPIAGAIGGMLVPALFYYGFNPEPPASRGWGIPMATDIAFAVGILSFFGRRVPLALKVFLLALAIVDDLGAVLVIALFYTETIHALYLAAAAGALGFVLALQRLKVGRTLFYVLVGLALWYAVLRSGVHATVAGVLLGLLTPLRFSAPGRPRREILGPLLHRLHPWVSYGIMPIFALANAGVPLSSASSGASPLSNGIFLGVSLGLFLGKPLGVLGAAKLVTWLGFAHRPRGVSWAELAGVGALAGVGFTMSLFVSHLALYPEQELFSKLGILAGSLASIAAGGLTLSFALPAKKYPRPGADPGRGRHGTQP